MLAVGSVCRVKWFIKGSRNVANISLIIEEVGTEVRKWLRQQSKDFDTMVK
jgi:hypothetical protein